MAHCYTFLSNFPQFILNFDKYKYKDKDNEYDNDNKKERW